MLWIDVWEDGAELAHLEWPDCAEELTAAVCLQTFVDKSVRIASADMPAAAIQATVETGEDGKRKWILQKHASGAATRYGDPWTGNSPRATRLLDVCPSCSKGGSHLWAQC